MTDKTSIRESRGSFKSYRQTRLRRRAAIICGVILLGTHLTAHAAILVVTNTTDSDAGSLRQAILDSNASVGVLDTITFNISGAGVQTIVPLTILPAITDPVVIDGYTQPGSSPNTLAIGNNSVHLIELNGNANSMGTGGLVNALTITAGNSTVRGLVINRFNSGNTGANNITLQTLGGNKIEGCFIGLDATGEAADPTSYFSAFAGVAIQDSPNNTIGGTTPGVRNVIAGRLDGISIRSTDSSNNAASSGTIVQGNYIGINAAGTIGFFTPPGTGSVSFINTGIQIGAGPPSGSSNNLIGGTSIGARNVISGTASHDILLNDSAITGNVIQGNYLGCNATGTASIFGTGNGITLQRTAGVTIGGVERGQPHLRQSGRRHSYLRRERPFENCRKYDSRQSHWHERDGDGRGRKR